MACKQVMIPRQRMLTFLTFIFAFAVQGVVVGWKLPKSQMTMKLPVDFPTFQIFHKVIALPEIMDSPEDLQVEFHIKKLMLFVRGAQGSKKFLNIDQFNGTLWLTKRVTDMSFYRNSFQGSKPQRIFANISIRAQTRKGSKLISKQMSIILEFEGLLSRFCEPNFFACFPSAENSYNLSEGSVLGEEFDYLQNLAFPYLCPNTTAEYDLTSDYDAVEINRTSGALLLSEVPDFEKTILMTFNVTCSTANASFSMVGNINVLDINDNPPTTQNGTTTATLTYGIKSGESSLKFAVNVVDKDSENVNDLVVRIEDDSRNLFAVKTENRYALLGDRGKSYLQAVIESKSALSFPDREYQFLVVFEDKSLVQKDRTVIYRIFIVNETELELGLKDIYEINVSSNAAPFSRLLQLSEPALNYKYHLDMGVKDYDWLGVTEQSGIVYVRDSELMPRDQPKSRRLINWSFNNGTHFKTGNILLIFAIPEQTSKLCVADSKWCASNKNETGCVESCGNGSPSGLCEWRTGDLTSNIPTEDYATCSPDLSVCPDGKCDELEQLEPTLCPQDCAKHFNGEVLVPNNGQRLKARGPCFCSTIERCTCVKPFGPAEWRHRKSELRYRASTPQPTIEIDNTTVEATSTMPEIAPFPGLLTDGSCGPGCILFASFVPAGLLLVVMILLVTRRMRSVRMSKHKFVSSHISLSGVPSDYVDERSNSAQESRNTPSETSSFGKATIDAKWDFPRNRLQLLSPLGEGEFGQVMKAQAWNIAGVKGYTTVAVKMLKENGGIQEKQDLITEFLLLKEISHPNIVRLLGASTEKNGQFYLIVEFAELGSLKPYLRKRRRHNNCCKYNATYGVEMAGRVEGSRDYYQFPCERSRHEPNHSYFHKEQLSFAWQIAKGMTYLSDMKLVHRDLATRNVLLAKHRVVKISDFGLSRDIYEGDAYLKKTKGRVPVKWMAIESLEDQVYTSRSDVWSFGVVLWEIMMLGATPYPGITPQRLYNLLKAGYRMTKPENCSDELYYLMRQCWRAIPRERPSFKEIVLKLDLMLQDTVEYMNFSPKGPRRRRSRELIPPPNGIVPTLQYTTVLIENDEEESDPESYENNGLARLFSQSPRNQANYTNSRESAA